MRIPILFVALIFLSVILVSWQRTAPFKLTQDLAPQDFGKHGKIPDRDIHYSFTRYTKEASRLLSKTPDQDLIEFSCSDSFLRTFQGAYILETIETQEMETIRIKNEDLIDFLREKEQTFPRGKKFLTGRICVLRDKTILLFYSIGAYDPKIANILTAKGAIAYSQDNIAYLEIFSPNLLSKKIFKLGESAAHLRCDEVFQFTKPDLFMLCESVEDYSTNYEVSKLNLGSGKMSILKKCINGHKDRLETSCN